MAVLVPVTVFIFATRSLRRRPAVRGGAERRSRSPPCRTSSAPADARRPASRSSQIKGVFKRLGAQRAASRRPRSARCASAWSRRATAARKRSDVLRHPVRHRHCRVPAVRDADPDAVERRCSVSWEACSGTSCQGWALRGWRNADSTPSSSRWPTRSTCSSSAWKPGWVSIRRCSASATS